MIRWARSFARRADPRQRSAVLLAGSWARGDAHEGSDIDLWVVRVKGRSHLRLLEQEGRLVSVRYSTVADERREMRDPGRWDGAIPGWLHARVLYDPRGIAQPLRSEARRRKRSVDRAVRDRYLAYQLAYWSEEVVKLLRALERGERETAAVERNLLANHLAFLRVLPMEKWWDTENGFWEKAGRWAGPQFRRAQRAALAIQGEGWKQGCEAALELYSLTARANLSLLRGDHRRVVLAACRRAGYPIDEPARRR